MAQATIYKPHSAKQDRALFSDKRIVLCGTGIQWGKTEAGCWKMRMAIHKYPDPKYNFLVCAPNYKILQQSTLPTFLRVMEGLGRYNGQEACFYVHGAGRVFFRTNTNPDSVVGIPRVKFIHCDEAGLFSLYFWQNIQARAAYEMCQIILTTSPYTLNWVYKELIRPKQKDPTARDDVELIQARSNENPYFPNAEFERQKSIMEPSKFRMIYGGEWGKPEGLVYDCFSLEDNVIEPVMLPIGTKYYAACDWGYNHPFVMQVRGITPEGRHYQVAEVYKRGLTLPDMVALCRQRMNVWQIQAFYCDPSQPGFIEEFKRNGIPAIGANNDIRAGVDLHYELIKSGKFKIFAGTSPNSEDEYETYHWPDDKDLKPDDDSKERNPVKQDDDCMDCARYLTIMTYKRSGQKLTPKTPDGSTGDRYIDRIKRLKIKPKGRQEVW